MGDLPPPAPIRRWILAFFFQVGGDHEIMDFDPSQVHGEFWFWPSFIIYNYFIYLFFLKNIYFIIQWVEDIVKNSSERLCIQNLLQAIYRIRNTGSE